MLRTLIQISSTSALDIDRWPAGPKALFTQRASGSSTPLARRGQRP